MPHLLKYNKEGFIKGRYEDLEYWRKDAIEQGLDLKTSFTDYSRIVPSNYTGPNTRKGTYDPYVTVQKWVDLVGFEGYAYPLQGKMSNNQLANAQLDFKRKTIESEQELTSLKLKQVELQDNYVNEIKLMTPTECSSLLQKALFIQAECIIKLMENIELDADFRNDDGVSLVQTANRPCSKALYGFIMDKLKPLASEESYHPIKKVVKNIVPIPKIDTNLASVQKDKDILNEFVGQMNNINLGNAQEVKDDVKSTGENVENIINNTIDF
jgi:CxxC motif-containing protein